MSNLIKIAGPPDEPRASAVYVHGLGGHHYNTWRCGPDGTAWDADTTFWPRWVARDCEKLAVYLVGYDAPVSHLRGSAMHVTDQATNILFRILAEPALARGPLILIGHSLGGLLIKELLRTAESMARNQGGAADLIERVEKVAFLATPHTGAGLASLGDRLRIVVRPSEATGDLTRNDSNLRDLNLWYRDWANNRGIAHLILTETQPTTFFGKIVPPDSADPGLANVRPCPIAADHISIAKPVNDKSDIYVLVRDFITRPVERPKPPTETKLDALSEGQRVLMEQNATLVALLHRDKGIPRAALVGHLVRLGARDDIVDDDIPKFLERFANEFPMIQEQLRRMTNDDPEVSAVRKKAAELLDAGHLDDAKALLSRARTRISELRQERSREEAALLGDEASINRLELNYRAAATKFGEAAALIAFDAQTAFNYMLEQGNTLVSQGSEFGDNAALVEAIAVWRRAVGDRPRTTAPDEYSAAMMGLGNALYVLGERESGTAKLEEAVTVYHEALKERPRERAPLDWAAIQQGLGNVLFRLGERESGTAKLEEAVTAYHEALKERSRARAPLDWAATQDGLGSAFSALGLRERASDSRTAKFEAAVAAYGEALKERTRARMPLEWAATMHNLGYALRLLGELESGTDNLEKAVAVYREALKETSRDRRPLDWAISLGDEGVALMRLAERRKDPVMAETALSQITLAFERMRDAEHAPNAMFYEKELPNARALVARLSGQ